MRSFASLASNRQRTGLRQTGADRLEVPKGTFAMKSIAKKLAVMQARGTAARANSAGLFCSDESARGCDAVPCAVAFNPSIHKPLAMDERLPCHGLRGLVIRRLDAGQKFGLGGHASIDIDLYHCVTRARFHAFSSPRILPPSPLSADCRAARRPTLNRIILPVKIAHFMELIPCSPSAIVPAGRFKRRPRGKPS